MTGERELSTHEGWFFWCSIGFSRLAWLGVRRYGRRMPRRHILFVLTGLLASSLAACERRFDDAAALPRGVADVQRTYRPSGKPWQLRIHAPVVYRGVKVLYGLELFPDGSIRSAQLAEQRSFSGVTCRKGSMVSFYPNGRLRSGFLAGGASVAGKRFDANTFLRFSRVGKLVGAVLPGRHGTLYDAEGKALPCDGARVVLLGAKEGWGCTLAKPWTIGGLPAKGDSTVWFDARGRLRLLVLARDHTLRGKRWPAGSVLALTADGKPQ